MKKRNSKSNGNKKSSDKMRIASNGRQSAYKRNGLHETRIDLSEKVRSRVCDLLNQTLAETLDMYSQTKQAHWNVKGVHFYQLHLLFDEIAGELSGYVDMFAERITTLGGTAFGTVRMSANASTLPEYPVDIAEGMDHVVALAERLAHFGAELRKNIDTCDDLGDLNTADLYTEVSRDIDMRLWFLEAHLQAQSAEHESKLTHVAARPKR